MNAPDGTVYTVEAYNLSHASENKIHDDAVAQKLGFSGGLVPGVEVYAYACHPAVRRWGRDWLERGHMECRFLKPVYDGHLAVVTAKASDGGLDIKVESQDVLCATAEASLPAAAEAPPIHAYVLREPPANRPPADEKNWPATPGSAPGRSRLTPDSRCPIPARCARGRPDLRQ